MLFHVLKKFPHIKQAVINDINPHLTTSYRVVKERPQDLITALSAMEQEYLALNNEQNRTSIIVIRNYQIQLYRIRRNRL